jgi:hypothetical protein
LALGAGITCTIIGAVIAGASNSVTSVFYILFGIEIGLTIFASVFFAIGYCIVYTQRIARGAESAVKMKNFAPRIIFFQKFPAL